MRISHINIQQTLLTLNHKQSTEQLINEIECRCNTMINQISIFNSKCDTHTFPKLPDAIELLIIRKSNLIQLPVLQITGCNLKVVQLPYCNLQQFPRINSANLHKLNVSNNQIQQIRQISNKALKLLDIRNNKLIRITRQIYDSNITLFYEFASKKGSNYLTSKSPKLIEVQSIVGEVIEEWNSEQLIDTCEQIIDYSNSVLLSQLLPYLSNQFASKIYELAKMKKKHNIVELLIRTDKFGKPSNQQALQLLMPAFIQKHYLIKINLDILIKTISLYNNQKQRVVGFLDFITSEHKGKNYFIQSQKDLIYFMKLNVSYQNSYELEFLMSQKMFFTDYDFNNQAILKYLLQFDSLVLLSNLLELPTFNDKLFALNQYKRLLRPNKKAFKVLRKQEKAYRNGYKYKNDLYFPQYRQRKSFCLKNDLYDYQILSEYEQMQCSYSRKDLKYTFKFCNKQNEISVAKRIETVLKKKCLKTMQIKRSQYSSYLSQ